MEKLLAPEAFQSEARGWECDARVKSVFFLLEAGNFLAIIKQPAVVKHYLQGLTNETTGAVAAPIFPPGGI